MSQTPPTTEETLQLYETFRSYIRHEDTLINFRTTWFITLQSVLFGIYGFTVQKYFEVAHRLVSDQTTALNIVEPTKDDGNILGNSIRLIEYIINGTPFVGVVSCIACYISIKAAWNALEGIKEKSLIHKELFDLYDLPEMTGGSAKNNAPVRGLIIGISLPFILIVFWTLSFIKFSIRLQMGIF